jgi:two-component sensor histidine kinase
MASGIGRQDNDSGTGEIIALPGDGSQLGRALLHALRNAGIAVLYQDRELKTVWARNMRAPWFAGDANDPKNGLPEAQAERLTASRRNVIATGNPERFEISVPGEDGMRWFEIWVDADFTPDGAVQGVMTTKIETTEQKRREQTLRALLREVSHRSKNLLAIIQSIASQTGRYSDTITDFLARFRGRLQSLAASQDLVTSSNWRGAALRELASGQVGRYGSDPERSLRFEGVNPFLNPNAALHIGLALHELAVNSVSYGALSRPEGFVQVTATLARDGNEDPSLSLVWTERIAKDAQRKNTKRFGSVALERVVPTSLNGKATLDISDSHLEYRLTVPHGNFETD